MPINAQDKHAFLSYVREDQVKVDRLQRILEAAGVRTWRDTEQLWPGQDWRIKIKQAITSDALVFIACFSESSTRRTKTYQNEELLVAVEQFRLLRPDQSWLIPVRLSNIPLPQYDLGASRTLDSLQRVDLFGDRWDEGAARLVAGVLRLLWGLSEAVIGLQPSPAGPIAWVDESVRQELRDAAGLRALNPLEVGMKTWKLPAGTFFTVFGDPYHLDNQMGPTAHAVQATRSDHIIEVHHLHSGEFAFLAYASPDTALRIANNTITVGPTVTVFTQPWADNSVLVSVPVADIYANGREYEHGRLLELRPRTVAE